MIIWSPVHKRTDCQPQSHGPGSSVKLCKMLLLDQTSLIPDTERESANLPHPSPTKDAQFLRGSEVIGGLSIFMSLPAFVTLPAG